MYELPGILADPVVRIVVVVTLVAIFGIALALLFRRNSRTKKCVLQAALLFMVAAPLLVIGLQTIGWELHLAMLPGNSANHAAESRHELVDFGSLRTNAPLSPQAPDSPSLEASPVTDRAFESSVSQKFQHDVKNSSSVFGFDKAFGLSFRTLIFGAWFSGMAVSLVLVVISIFNVVRLLRSCVPISDLPFEAVVRTVQASSTIQSLNVVVSDKIPAPVSIGLGQWNRIVIPEAVIGSISTSQFEQVVRHEAEHIANSDTLFQVVSRIGCAIWWWHPLVLLVDKMIGRAREEVCDDAVLEFVSPVEYGKTLLAISRLAVNWRRPVILVSLLGSRWSLEDRIKNLLKPRSKKMAQPGKVSVAAVVVGFSVLTVVASAAQIGNQEEQQEINEKAKAIAERNAHFEKDEEQVGKHSPSRELILSPGQSELIEIRRKIMTRETAVVPVFILDGYLGLSPDQQTVVEKLVKERMNLPLNPDHVYNYFPASTVLIDGDELRETLTDSQQSAFDELITNGGLSLIDQINSLPTQSRDDWVSQPVEWLKRGVSRQIDELDANIGLDRAQKETMFAAGLEAIDEIKEARGILHDRYAKIAIYSPNNDYVMQLMMDGPFYQIGNTKSWRRALTENFSEMELTPMENTNTTRTRLLQRLMLCYWKYDGHLDLHFTEEEHRLLDSILINVIDTEQDKATLSIHSFFDLNRRIDLRAQPKLKEFLNEEKWTQFAASFRNLDESRAWNMPLTKETAEQFAESQNPQPEVEVDFEQIEVEFVDDDGNPLADFKFRYVGFHMFDESRGWFLRLNTYGLKPLQTNEDGNCKLSFPAGEPVVKIAIATDDPRFQSQTINIEISGDEKAKIIVVKNKT